MFKILVTFSQNHSSPRENEKQIDRVVVALLLPKESKVRAVAVCIQRQVALFANVRSPMSDKFDFIYLATSPTSQPFVHDQGAELRVSSVVVCD